MWKSKSLIVSLLLFVLVSFSVFASDTGIYNIRDYGAKVDGITIDTIAIQTAINDAVRNGGGKVFFPAGICLTNESIKLSSYITLEGTGRSTIKATCAMGSLITSVNSNARLGYWVLRDLTLLANPGDICVNMTNVSRSICDRLLIRRTGDSGLLKAGIYIESLPGGGAYYNKIYSCDITSCEAGIYLKRSNACDIISTCIAACTTGILFDTVASGNVLFGTVELFTTGIELFNSSGCVIHGVYIEGTAPITNVGIRLHKGDVWCAILYTRWSNQGYTAFDPTDCISYELKDYTYYDLSPKAISLFLGEKTRIQRSVIFADIQGIHVKTYDKLKYYPLLCGVLNADGDILPGMDNKYYLGLNNTTNPRAWRGLIMCDQLTGKYYRIEIRARQLLLIDMTE